MAGIRFTDDQVRMLRSNPWVKSATPKYVSFTKEFMEPLGISAYRLARDIDVPVSRVPNILHDRGKITADTSIRLGRYFGVSERYFHNLQSDIDIRNAKPAIKEAVMKIRPVVV